jgi:hypothetical protein
MLQPWLIEKLEHERREREAQEQPALRIEIQRPDERPDLQPTDADRPFSGVIELQLW